MCTIVNMHRQIKVTDTEIKLHYRPTKLEKQNQYLSLIVDTLAFNALLEPML